LILHGRIIEQVIDRGERGSFRKEILITPGKVPLAMVRKRWVGAPKSGPRLVDALDLREGDTRAAVLLIHVDNFNAISEGWGHLPVISANNR